MTIEYPALEPDVSIARSPHALCVCDMREVDHPIIFANDNFFVQTGYSPEEVINRNCRFLQGPGTDPETAGYVY